MGERPNIHFNGTTTGDSIYGVGLPGAKDGWIVKHELKKATLGDLGMPWPGGKHTVWPAKGTMVL